VRIVDERGKLRGTLRTRLHRYHIQGERSVENVWGPTAYGRPDSTLRPLDSGVRDRLPGKECVAAGGGWTCCPPPA